MTKHRLRLQDAIFTFKMTIVKLTSSSSSSSSTSWFSSQAASVWSAVGRFYWTRAIARPTHWFRIIIITIIIVVPIIAITITISIIIIVLIIINLVFPLLLSIILIIIILNILNGKCLNDIEPFPQAGMSWQCANQTGTYHPIISRCSGGREGLGGIREEPWRNDLIHVSINCRSNNHFSVQFVWPLITTVYPHQAAVIKYYNG